MYDILFHINLTLSSIISFRANHLRSQITIKPNSSSPQFGRCRDWRASQRVKAE